LPDILKQAAETVLEVAARGVAAAMNVRNARPKAGVRGEGRRKRPEAPNVEPDKKQAKDPGTGETSAPAAAPGQTVSVVNETKKP
jgi:hypothetical protein